MRARGPLRSVAVTLAVAVAATVTGCGLSADDEPRNIAAADLPTDILDPNTTSTTAPSGSTAAVVVYLLSGSDDSTHLRPVSRTIEVGRGDADVAARAAERVRALLLPLSEAEEAAGLVSSIPADTALIDTKIDGPSQELTVNLSGALFDVQLKALANSFAQIVWTVTELEGVRSVRFQAEGVDFRALNADGAEQDGAVTTADYRSLAPR